MSTKFQQNPEGEREKLRVMDQWLDAVCAELDVDRELVERVTGPALDLISEVAHGPSRPGAPMTALVVGLATREGDDAEALAARVAQVSELTRTWQARDEDDA